MPHSRIRMVDRLGIQECSIKATHVHQFPLQFLNPKEGVQKNIRKPYKAFRKIESEPQWPMQQSDTVVRGLHLNSSLSEHASLRPLNLSPINHLEKPFQGSVEV